MFDTAIINGSIVDGTRTKAYSANLYFKNGQIPLITPKQQEAASVYDAQGKTVAPGFIDIHSHSDISYLVTSTMEAKLIGGVTFELTGQCGNSLVPLSEKNTRQVLHYAEMLCPGLSPDIFPAHDVSTYAAHIREHSISTNLGIMIGHGTLRACVAGYAMRQLRAQELDTMCALLDEQLCQGAVGLSLGLIYPPGSFSKTDEIIALAQVVARHDKMLAVHMRNENADIFNALDEMIHVADRTGVKLQISHLKMMGTPQWGRAEELLTRIDLACARGIRIHCDQYPYTTSSSSLLSSLPKQVADGGAEKMVKRLEDDGYFRELVAGGLPELYNRGGPDNVRVAITPDGGCPWIVGKTLTEIAEQLGLPLFDAIRYILIACKGNIKCHYRCMDEGDLLHIMSRRDVCVCSDGCAYDLSRPMGTPHPRYTGSFPRFLRLVREKNLMPLEDAIYKITALPSTLMGFGDKFGFLRPGYDATVTIFDAQTVADHATYAQPTLAPDGILAVFVNGALVLDRGSFTAARPGRAYLL